MMAHHDVAAGTGAVVRKPALEETAVRGTRAMQRALTDGLRRSGGFSRSHNFYVLA
jgi:hypothetical protein